MGEGELYRASVSSLRLLHHGVDLLFGRELGAAPKRSVAEFRVVTLQRVSADDTLLQQAVVKLVWLFTSLHHELVESLRAAEEDLGLLSEFVDGIVSLRQILLREFFHAFASV